ncbi:MAG: biotin/lipoyl-containing protein, partial [Halomonas sp.]
MSDFMLPDIGEGIVECEVVEWHVAEGDVIEEDQPVVEVMTDKALVEITAPEPGRVTRLYVTQGDTARVHAPLFAYEAEGEPEVEERPVKAAREASAPPADSASTASEPVPASAPRAASPKDFILPDIGEGIVECEVVEWRIKEGERIEEDQPLVDVMTDKALVEITAPEAGVVHRLHVAQGEIARVHAPLFAYVPDDAGGEATAAATPTTGGQASVERPAEGREAMDEEAPPVPGRGPYGRIPAAPAVRRLLREHGLSLEQVPGSGKQGRVLKEDVLRYLEGHETAGDAGRAAAPAPSPADTEAVAA